MRFKITLISILVCLFSTACFADGVTITFLGSGWLIKSTYTNPAPVPGIALTINAVITYEVDGILQTTTANESIVGTVPATTTKKIYTSTVPLKTTYNITEISGDGTAGYDTAGKLIFNVNSPNDGKAHTMQFKLMLI